MEEHPRWAGGRNPDGKGYMRVTVAPKKWVYEHRLVAEQMLGRSLEPGEVVHHIDGNGMNNDPENLRIVSQAEHLRLHPRKRQEFCKHGHPFAGENLRIDNRGHRVCRTRNIERSRRWKEAHAV